MDLVVSLFFRDQFTGNDFVIKHKIGLDNVPLFADFPNVKGNADGVKVILFFDFTTKKLPHKHNLLD